MKTQPLNLPKKKKTGHFYIVSRNVVINMHVPANAVIWRANKK